MRTVFAVAVCWGYLTGAAWILSLPPDPGWTQVSLPVRVLVATVWPVFALAGLALYWQMPDAPQR